MFKKGLIISAFTALLFSGCDNGSLANQSVNGGTVATSGGNTSASGGSVQTTTGGTSSAGGTSLVTGGSPMGGSTLSTGGAIVATGGNTSMGGQTATGGTPSSGGSMSTGGKVVNGGASATGGMTTSGGATASGGSTGTTACVPAATAARLKEEHHEGQACIACHKNQGESGTLAGTIFAASGNTPVPGATVTVTQSNGQILKLVTASNGNFYTNNPIDFPAKVEVSKCPDTKPMLATITNGDCNSCHNSGMRMRLP